MTKRYVGARLRHRVEFFASDGTTPADPTTVRLRTLSPEPAIERTYVYGTDAEIVKESVGVYYFDAFYEIAGRHRRRWEGEGTVQAIIEEWTEIEPSAFLYQFNLPAANGLTVGSPQIGTPTLAEV